MENVVWSVKQVSIVDTDILMTHFVLLHIVDTQLLTVMLHSLDAINMLQQLQSV